MILQRFVGCLGGFYATVGSTLAKYGISYFFPILPTSLTGLDKVIFRIPYSSPVLEVHGYRASRNYKEQRNMNKPNTIGKKVFISYSSKQKAHADDLHYMLEKAGYEPILDNYDIKGGATYIRYHCIAYKGCELFCAATNGRKLIIFVGFVRSNTRLLFWAIERREIVAGTT